MKGLAFVLDNKLSVIFKKYVLLAYSTISKQLVYFRAFASTESTVKKKAYTLSPKDFNTGHKTGS